MGCWTISRKNGTKLHKNIQTDTHTHTHSQKRINLWCEFATKNHHANEINKPNTVFIWRHIKVIWIRWSECNFSGNSISYYVVYFCLYSSHLFVVSTKIVEKSKSTSASVCRHKKQRIWEKRGKSNEWTFKMHVK